MVALLLHVMISGFVAVHILLRRHRQPEARAAWLLIVVLLPYLGALSYLLLGQTSIGRRRALVMERTFAALPRPDAPDTLPRVSDRAAEMLRAGRAISGYPATSGNAARLMADSDAAITTMIADIDAARHHVHVLFYIWLDDGNGTRMAEALIRAAGRGVACRIMVDDLGSRGFVKSALWQRMAKAGVQGRTALPVGNPLLRMLKGRIDLRNHRKLLVIDNAITYCGSQNCADPAFLPKARFGPWVDVMLRLTGPVVRQNQHLFASDWMGNGGDDITPLLSTAPPPPEGNLTAQVIATGPTFHASAMAEMFTSLAYAAQRRLFITTPYYVPTQALQSAICAAARRGVAVTLVLPARNDDFAVGATSRSHYESLLEAGVRIHEFLPGLLHAKTLTLDDEMTLIGSANMDRRSFDLNYENNILLVDPAITQAMRARQESYLLQSRQITPDETGGWGIGLRLMHNILAIVGPVL